MKYQSCWSKYGFCFWHEFRQGEEIDIVRHFDRCKSKFEHLRERFRNLDRFRRLVFVLSNIPNNLTEVRQQTGSLDCIFDNSKIARLKQALTGYLKPEFEMLVLSVEGRFEGRTGSGYELVLFESDESELKGNMNAWLDYLRWYFGKHQS